MACILVAPTETTKGVLIVTTQERDRLIFKQPAIRAQVEQLKARWVIGLHHNWHDHRFTYDPLFDFSMAGEDDLREVSGRPVPLIPMDACNFVPEHFRPSQGEKLWDILYVARAVYFKRIPEFFQCMRTLYDQGHQPRVLFLCPVPPYDRRDKKTAFYEIRDVYDRMFTEAEKDRFTLLTMNYRYPFPLDLETLAHFYRSSRLFVHFADDERRCRVAGYAWASGLPVVGMSCVGSLLPGALKANDYYYEVNDYAEFPGRIVQALDDVANKELRGLDDIRAEFATSQTERVLDRTLRAFFEARQWAYDSRHAAFKQLDIRLGRHHSVGVGPNTVDVPFGEFLRTLENEALIRQTANEAADPERALERLASRPESPAGLAGLWRRKP